MDDRVRGLVVASAVATGFLMLLGVYTAAAGAGLTCAARWPLCDGAVFGLFPANWGSFVEWFHRLVAMLTGFLILGTTVAAWRHGFDRRVRYALAVATLLLPSQIILGALTVTEYELLILTAHFVTAATIYTAVVAAAAWASAPGTDLRRLRRAAVAVAVAVPVVAALSPRVLVAYTATVQFVYYGLGLAAYGLLVAVLLWTRADTGLPSPRGLQSLVAAAAAVLLVVLVVGRQAYAFDAVTLVGAVVVGAFVAAATVLLYRQATPGDDAGTGRPATSSD
jgi:cytochrome c oxidase assembly protein subunit 15